ncbi:MAG TPA: hypothetical protein VK468_10195 [Pyrinomonadaceae bacterium]|nr:hypothetical protein [Pyrinomonadaceae bacterium]
MIDRDSVEQVISQYKKHGWVLRRVLFSSAVSDDVSRSFGEIVPQPAAIDALWFSRRSLPDREAWELRRLSGSPFALVEVIDDETDAAAAEAIRRSVEQRIAAAPAGPASH